MKMVYPSRIEIVAPAIRGDCSSVKRFFRNPQHEFARAPVRNIYKGVEILLHETVRVTFEVRCVSTSLRQVFTKLVGVISARVEIARNSRISRWARERSIARNS